MLWRRRHEQPIKNMRPWLLFVCNACLCLHAMSLCLVSSLAGQPAMKALVPILVMFSLQNAVFDSFTMFATSLYVAYRRTHTQALLADDATADEDKFDRRMARIRKLSWMLSPQGIGSFMAVSFLSMASLTAVYAFIACPDLITSSFLDAYVPVESFLRITCLYFTKIVVQCVFVALLSIRLRVIVDKFGVKAILRTVAITALVGGVLYAAVVDPLMNPIAPNMLYSILFIVILIDCILVRSLVIPIYQTYQPDADDIALPGEGNSAVDALERFLHSSEHRFKAFRQGRLRRKQLEEELRVENLLFWRDAEAYRRTFPSPDSSEKAVLIWKTYLRSGSPLEINISGNTRSVFDAIGPPTAKVRRGHSRLTVSPSSTVHTWPLHLLQRDVFRPACEQVVALMCDNALGRFQRDNPDIWDEFINETQACRFSRIDLLKASKPATTKEYSAGE
ncbi:hypothetical protein PBRA_007496 [Plasmodiophora brassicae]|uniref:RGS domain-containing protein n=1 Tax=Plasmodiophora brassicae TaxID=37360 RepID=A0A0G4IWY9_PLABS|nr:hypothetical protein PBRA_007496 [Plasmodiophora brassicae]